MLSVLAFPLKWPASSRSQSHGLMRSRFCVQTAHYLIQTHLEVKLGIAPSVTAAPFHVNARHKRGLDGPANPDHKRARFGRAAPRYLTSHPTKSRASTNIMPVLPNASSLVPLYSL